VFGELHISASPVVTRLVRALETLAQQVPISEFGVIGGLAVMVRLEGAHRVTDDLDTVATQHGESPITVEVVVGPQGTIEGTKVDCIGVGDVPAAELPLANLPDNPLDRAFVLSHRWALDTAENQVLRADYLDASASVTCSPMPAPSSQGSSNQRHEGKGGGPIRLVAICSISFDSLHIQY
jgi:hypothetical protein